MAIRPRAADGTPAHDPRRIALSESIRNGLWFIPGLMVLASWLLAVVLTGDTGPSGAVERLAQGADVLVAEADAVSPADRDRFIDMMAGRNHWSADRTRRFRAHFVAEHLDTGEIGQIAAKESKAGVAGYIVSFPIPEVVMGINSFMIGEQSINTNLKAKIVWVN